MIRKSGGAAIGFYPDDGSGQKGKTQYNLLSFLTTQIERKRYSCNQFAPYDNYLLVVEIFRIENFDMVPVEDEKMHGKFFGGDCYVIRYSYQNSEGRDAYIVYFWQVSFNILALKRFRMFKIF